MPLRRVNAALCRVANQRAAARMLELLEETGAELSDEALRGAWRDGDYDLIAQVTGQSMRRLFDSGLT